MEGGETERCMRNRLKSGTSQYLLARRRQNWPLPGTPNSLGRRRMKEMASTEAAGCTINGAQGAILEILVE
jgi:hypothetical protein